MFRSSTLFDDDVVLFEMIGTQSEADGDAYIKALFDLSARTEPAILIMLISGETELPHETRKQSAAWFKQNRDQLARFAKGVIRVEQDHNHADDPDHAEAVENSNFAKMLPFPIKHAETLEAAFELARNWPVALEHQAGRFRNGLT